MLNKYGKHVKNFYKQDKDDNNVNTHNYNLNNENTENKTLTTMTTVENHNTQLLTKALPLTFVWSSKTVKMNDPSKEKHGTAFTRAIPPLREMINNPNRNNVLWIEYIKLNQKGNLRCQSLTTTV